MSFGAWDLNSHIDQVERKVIYTISATPKVAEMQEKIMKIAEELSTKINNYEIEKALMIMPLDSLCEIQRIIDEEIVRREQEYSDIANRRKHTEGKEK